ncbi:hypothetical protein [Williamsoniiplasma lucivorax]|uniref:Uncharacterized protein n=1 Tax=Williamsoniiplasma lucivorax TaxID=209274 RepID=A0A2S5RDK0_9MOLU|nr:hypothetical protein [Williamsoniiplasma lucivorax]PPE05282.1 hypothetical protein ELUCI_v1c08180 [Williamsoniiplasma lucivorax]
MNKETPKLIEQLEIIVHYLKTKKYQEVEILRIKKALSSIVDFLIINSNDFVFLLDQEDKRNGLNLNFNVNAKNKNLMSFHEVTKILYYLKTIFAMLLSYLPDFFNYYIYSEVKYMLMFYVKETLDDPKIEAVNKRHKISDTYYHKQSALFKYIYSIYDKLLYVNLHVTQKFELNNLTEQKHYQFSADFLKSSLPLIKDGIMARKMEVFLKALDRSSAFHYIRILRNNVEHNFINPELRFNYALQTQLLFIMLMKIVIEIEFHFKRDSDIYELLTTNHTKNSKIK